MSSEKRALLSLTSPAADKLVPVRLDAHETISELYRFEIDAVSTEQIDAQSMINKPACLSVNHHEQATRYFHGIISEFGPAGHTPIENRYRLVLRPQLVQTDLRIDCRMFFNKSVEDVVKIILNEAGVTKTAFRLYSASTPRKAIAQYNETQLHFITRLMEEEGWYYFFEHASDGHTLVITNDNNGFTSVPEGALRVGVTIAPEVLTDLYKPDLITHGKVGLRDYDHDAPSKNLKVEQSTVLKHGGTSNRAVFHWPALTRDIGEAKARAKRRMEAAEAAVSLVEVAGSNAGLFAGAKFKLKDDNGVETPYVVREITHSAEDEQRRSDTGIVSYSNRLAAFPSSVPWRQPMTTARPRMEGLHTAIVLAPAGEEIYTDDQGRIKVRFFWDWRADATADSSDWVRVVQPWAGNQWGGQFIPRVDTEVAVAFLDGDPDRPIVIGGFYNANDKPIYPVGEKTKLGFRSRSVTKGGTADFNEFTFDDKKGQEKLFLHAQKDMTTEVENDQLLKVDHDRTVEVKNDETVTIKEGNQSNTVKMGNQSNSVDMGNQSNRVKMGNVDMKVDLGSITVEAMQSITIKVGQSSVTIDQMGVTVKGMMIKIEGQVQTQVKGLMTQVNGDAMLQIQGAITMIN
jgi:type VI secretion system secreted protein VgrG